MATRLLPAIALTGVTAVWGSSFFLIKDLTQQVSPLDFLGVRFTMAGLLVGAIFFSRLRKASSRAWFHGVVLGMLYAAAQMMQTVGLSHTDASVSGFITGMYVVLTPLAVWAFEKIRPSLPTWAAVAAATIGLMVLSLHGWSFGMGEAITLGGSVFYAVHLTVLGRYAREDDPLTLSVIQLIVIGAVCLLTALPGGIELPSTGGAWVSLIYMVVFAAVAALIIQTWAQSKIPATEAAIIMTTEPVFASVFAIAFGGEPMTLRLAIGGALVLAAMVFSEVLPSLQKKNDSGSSQPGFRISAGRAPSSMRNDGVGELRAPSSEVDEITQDQISVKPAESPTK